MLYWKCCTWLKLISQVNKWMSVQTTGSDISVIFASLKAINLVIKGFAIWNLITVFLSMKYFHNSSGSGTQTGKNHLHHFLSSQRFKLGPAYPQALITSNYPAEGTQPEKCYSITIITFFGLSNKYLRE